MKELHSWFNLVHRNLKIFNRFSLFWESAGTLTWYWSIKDGTHEVTNIVLKSLGFED